MKHTEHMTTPEQNKDHEAKSPRHGFFARSRLLRPLRRLFGGSIFSRPGRSVGVIFLVIFAGIIVLSVWTTRDAYLALDSRIISRSDFERARTAYQNNPDFLLHPEYTQTQVPVDDDGSLQGEELNNFVKNELIMGMALELEAEKQGQVVTSEDIEKSLLSLSRALQLQPEQPTPESTREYLSSLGFDESETNRYITRRQLVRELEDSLVQKLDVTILRVYFDEGDESQVDEISTDVNTVAVSLLEEDMAYEDLVNKVRQPSQNSNTQFYPTQYKDAATARIIDILNSAENFSGDTHFQDGYITEALRFSDHVAVYRIDIVSEGDYDSWSSFLEKQQDSAHEFTSAFDFRRLVVGLRVLLAGNL